MSYGIQCLLCFQFSFRKKTTIKIEVFIERPSNLLARSQMFSNYKHHNTVKVLLESHFKDWYDLHQKHGEDGLLINT